jgi:hypothetical protein
MVAASERRSAHSERLKNDDRNGFGKQAGIDFRIARGVAKNARCEQPEGARVAPRIIAEFMLRPLGGKPHSLSFETTETDSDRHTRSF